MQGVRYNKRLTAIILAGTLFPACAMAEAMAGTDVVNSTDQEAASHAANGNAVHGRIPAGVSGAHMVRAGELRLGVAGAYMRMEGNYIGSSRVSPETIVTTVPSNVFIGTTREMYRIVPSWMNVENLAVNAMYGVSDDVNVTLMVPYLRKTMSMTTFAGSTGATILGQSSSTTQGAGDMTAGASWRFFHQGEGSYALLNLGVSLPTGSITESATMLSPMNRLMTSRASYGMQLGAGTVDLLPGLTYVGNDGRGFWGAAYRGRFATKNNSEGYHYGARHQMDAWTGYAVAQGVAITGRIAGAAQGRIHGADPQISGLMQGSNPNFYGGRKIDVFAGLAFSGMALGLKGANLSVEAGDTVYQYLNGPQLGSSWQVIAAFGMIF